MPDLREARADYESADLDGQIARIAEMIQMRDTLRPDELGILLALRMAKEIREGKPLGAETGALVAAWMDEHPGSVVEEAIAFARELLLKPSEMASRIAERLFGEKS